MVTATIIASVATSLVHKQVIRFIRMLVEYLSAQLFLATSQALDRRVAALSTGAPQNSSVKSVAS